MKSNDRISYEIWQVEGKMGQERTFVNGLRVDRVARRGEERGVGRLTFTEALIKLCNRKNKHEISI